MAIQNKLQQRYEKLEALASKSEKPHRKRDLKKQLKRVSRRLYSLKKKAPPAAAESSE